MPSHHLPEPVIERLSVPNGSIRGSVYQLGHLQAGDWRLASHFRLGPHAHDALHASIVVSGAFEERAARGSTICEQSMVRVSPPGAIHDIRFSPSGARCVVVELRGGDAELRSLTPARNVFVRASELCRSIGGILNDLDAGDDLAPLRAECAVLSLFAQALRRATLRRPGEPPSWLLRVRDRLVDDPGGRVDLEVLAGDAGVHRVTLARAFHDHFGASVGSFARRVRLDRARRLLLHTNRRLSLVAADAGFSDQSHLSRHLRRAFGLTPAALRATGRR
jgi:AraC family transcriptional regulator